MKKTDIALLIIIISVSASLSYWIANATFGQAAKEPIVVRTIDKIEADKLEVDEKVFSEDAINPTVEAVIVGEDITSFMDKEQSESDETDDNESPLIDESDQQQLGD